MPATVRFRPEREAWFIFYRDGAKRWSQRVGPTAQDEADAREAAAAWNADLEGKREREVILHRGGPAPFDQVAKAWWEAKVPGMPASSVASKRCVIYERLIPFFTDEDCRRIDEDRVRACAVAQAAKGHARETVETTGSVLDSVLRWAWKRRWLEVMPAPRDRDDKTIRGIFREIAAARCPPPVPVEAWSVTEAAALLEAAASRGNWLGDPVLFASQTGCRRGELIALEWGDVDLPRGIAVIRQSKTRGQTKTTKSDQGRKIQLSPIALAMLRRRAKSGRSGIVFRDAKGKPWTDYGFAGYWVRARREAVQARGVRPLKFHCWRHTWATHALAATGGDSAWCALQIGDTLEVFIRRYAHAMPGTVRSLDFLDFSRHGAARSGAASPPEPRSGPEADG